MARDDAQMKLRLPDELRERIVGAATQANQSLNALIVSVLEREFPHPTIDLHELGAFLNSLVNEANKEDEGQDGDYFTAVNEVLGTLKDPWVVRESDGVISFYPYADRPSRRVEPGTTPDMPDNLKAQR